ncbi:MAG TPA: class A beta-lactamase, subclass A2 [Chryseolinea sp.]|nr:class A beta-lactamase, subclass A2 [Chryseolinea sp.]
MNKVLRLSLTVLFALNVSAVLAQENLRNDIAKLIKTVNGSVGVGVKHIESGDTLSVHGDVHFPMQSVYKFHLALAVLSEVDKGKLALDQKVFIRKEDFLPRTVSQIAEKYPDGNVELTTEDLLRYTVATSDNNGCDILFRLVGGPKKVDDYFRRTLAVKDLSIVNTEAEMHKDWDAQFNNWTTPRAMAQVLDRFYRKEILSPQSTDVLVKIMEATSTGKNRIKGHLPAGTVVAHKTGMGGNSAGVISAVNDVGIVTLPSGEHFAIALFISNPKDSVEELETVMAKISQLVFDYYTRSK